MQILLDVFIYKNKTQADAEDLGVDVPLSECVLEEHTFYNIDFIGPSFYHKQYCSISSGGEHFVVNKSYEQVKELINNARISKYN